MSVFSSFSINAEIDFLISTVVDSCNLLIKRKIIEDNEETYRIGEIEMWEIRAIIKKLKRRKAAGPDEIPTEVFKEMGIEGLEEVRTIMNIWWKEENITEDTQCFLSLV